MGYANDVLDTLMSDEVEVYEEAQAAVETMGLLAEVLADELDGSIRTVARALARRRTYQNRQPGLPFRRQ
jgi:hypothetical protein